MSTYGPCQPHGVVHCPMCLDHFGAPVPAAPQPDPRLPQGATHTFNPDDEGVCQECQQGASDCPSYHLEAAQRLHNFLVAHPELWPVMSGHPCDVAIALLTKEALRSRPVVEAPAKCVGCNWALNPDLTPLESVNICAQCKEVLADVLNPDLPDGNCPACKGTGIAPKPGKLYWPTGSASPRDSGPTEDEIDTLREILTELRASPYVYHDRFAQALASVLRKIAALASDGAREPTHISGCASEIGRPCNCAAPPSDREGTRA